MGLHNRKGLPVGFNRVRVNVRVKTLRSVKVRVGVGVGVGGYLTSSASSAASNFIVSVHPCHPSVRVGGRLEAATGRKLASLAKIVIVIRVVSFPV